jgi:hypothetical protein
LTPVFDLPKELLANLNPKQQSQEHDIVTDSPQEVIPRSLEPDENQPKKVASCTLCNIAFGNFVEQRKHTRSDWHGYNLKQRMQGLNPVSEAEFDKLIDELDLSISGSDYSTSDEDGNTAKGKEANLSTLLKKQARLKDDADPADDAPSRKELLRGSPMIWFNSPLLPSEISLGVYKALFNDVELSADIVNVLEEKQLEPIRPIRHGQAGKEIETPTTSTSPCVFLCMIGGGHFAGMIVSLTPKIIVDSKGQEERQAVVLAHKTFHRYTTRRKQGGSQSANDSAKGNAHSAGAGIRRANEAALEAEVRALLNDWKDMIRDCKLLFVRATGNTNRRTLFGAGIDQVLRSNDPRVRSFPFSTRRATQSELMRAFVELTRIKVSRVTEDALARNEELEQKATQKKTDDHKAKDQGPSKEEQAALLHTSQLQAMIRRSKAPGVVSYIKTNSISPNFVFQPPSSSTNNHAPTPLHMASSVNSPAVVLALLIKGGADPTILNRDGKVAFELAGERATRDAFRVARSELGEKAWDWEKARCPLPLTKAEADERDRSEKAESQKAEADRRKAETDRLNREQAEKVANNSKSLGGKMLGAPTMTAEDRREVEGRGLTPEMRMKLERERRARAAEERLKKMTGQK